MNLGNIEKVTVVEDQPAIPDTVPDEPITPAPVAEPVPAERESVPA